MRTTQVSHHSTKFSGHNQCNIGDITILVFYLILQYHFIKAPCDFVVRSPSRQVTILLSLVAIGTVVVELYWFHSVMRNYWQESIEVYYQLNQFGEDRPYGSRDIFLAVGGQDSTCSCLNPS